MIPMSSARTSYPQAWMICMHTIAMILQSVLCGNDGVIFEFIPVPVVKKRWCLKVLPTQRMSFSLLNLYLIPTQFFPPYVVFFILLFTCVMVTWLCVFEFSREVFLASFMALNDISSPWGGYSRSIIIFSFFHLGEGTVVLLLFSHSFYLSIFSSFMSQITFSCHLVTRI